MGYIYKNITGNTAETIHFGHSNFNDVFNELHLCNVHSSDAVNIDLYISKTYRSWISDTRNTLGEDGNWNDLESTTETYYILKNTTVPKGVTLTLKQEYFKWDPKEYSLYIKLDQSDSSVDVIFNGMDSKKAIINSRTSQGSSSGSNY